MDLSKKCSLPLLGEQQENLTAESLKIYFDTFIQELNTFNDHDDYMKHIDSIVTALLNINTNSFDDSTILEHSFLIILRDLSVDLLKNGDILVLKLINLFRKIYSTIDHDDMNNNLQELSLLSFEQTRSKYIVGQRINDNFSKLHTLFSNQQYLNILIHYRVQEEYFDTINQFLAEVIRKLLRRYFPLYPFMIMGPGRKELYLEEIIAHLCSSAYIDTFNHLFELIAQSNQRKLDLVESFYLVTCPIHIYSSVDYEIPIAIFRTILQKMFQVYVDILTRFTQAIKNCSEAVIEAITCLMSLLRSTCTSHELYQEFLGINQSLTNILWTIIYELSVKQEPHTHDLLADAMGQLFYGTFEPEILPKIKQLDIIPTLIQLLHNGKTETIQLESGRLLSVIMSVGDIQNRLNNMAHLVQLILIDIRSNLCNPILTIRVENTLLCLKSKYNLDKNI